MNRLFGLMAGAAMIAAAAVPAHAQEAVRGKHAGDFLIGASVIGVLPHSGGHVETIGGEPDASDSWTGQIDFTYFLMDTLSLNLIAATTRHELDVKDSAIGDFDPGRVWALPPTLTLQYHPLPQERFSPYIGVGVNYTVFYAEGGGRSAPVTDVDVKNAFGVALNAGLDIEIAPNWVANFDVKHLWLRPDVRVNDGAINATTRLDPWIVGAGIRYRF